jgi:hypothetical protein
MRLLRVLGIFLCVLALGSIAMAGKNSLGIREVSRVTFVAPVRVGTALLPAGDYVVRHTMEGQEHVMVFQRAHSKDVFKAKCKLVPLGTKANKDEEIYQLNTSNERVLQELIFRGDSAKHVF